MTWLYLVPVLKMSGAIPALPLYAFMACLRTTVLLLFYLKELYVYTVWVVAIPVHIRDNLCVLPPYFKLKNSAAICNIFNLYVLNLILNTRSVCRSSLQLHFSYIVRDLICPRFSRDSPGRTNFKGLYPIVPQNSLCDAKCPRFSPES
jgi:hypothetical protein